MRLCSASRFWNCSCWQHYAHKVVFTGLRVVLRHKLVFIFRNHAYIQKEFTRTVCIKTVISKMGFTRLSNESTERKVKTLISYLFLILKYKNYVLPILTMKTKADPLSESVRCFHIIYHTQDVLRIEGELHGV